jgi:NADH-quinone oxidoreductase subunit I
MIGMLLSVCAYCRGIVRGLGAVLVGMKVTLRHFFSRGVTMQYPDETWTMPRAFRGMLACDTDACIACLLCVKACPVDCITVEGVKEPGKAKKTCTKYVVDYQKCMVCGLCVEPCPTDAVFHSHRYETSGYDRKGCVIDWKGRTIRNPVAAPVA